MSSERQGPCLRGAVSSPSSWGAAVLALDTARVLACKLFLVLLVLGIEGTRPLPPSCSSNASLALCS